MVCKNDGRDGKGTVVFNKTKQKPESMIIIIIIEGTCMLGFLTVPKKIYCSLVEKIICIICMMTIPKICIASLIHFYMFVYK
jgi:hypothetical protein